MTTDKAETIKIIEYPTGRNIVHIPVRTPEEEARHHDELYKAQERSKKEQGREARS